MTATEPRTGLWVSVGCPDCADLLVEVSRSHPTPQKALWVGACMTCGARRTVVCRMVAE